MRSLTDRGQVVAWGVNSGSWPDYGQTTVPTDLSNVVAIAAGGYHSLALTDRGQVVTWGSNSSGQSTVPADLSNEVVAIAAGNLHSLALTTDGRVIAWGGNSKGESTVPAGLSNVVAIAAGWSHSLALVGDGLPGPRIYARWRNQDRTFSLHFSTVHRTSYRLQFKDALENAQWITLTNLPGNGALVILTDPSPPAGQHFYRVAQQQP